MPEDGGDLYFDTVTLSNFALAGRVDLLIERYGLRARITPEVLDEVIEGVALAYSGLTAIAVAIENGRLGTTGVLSADERETYGKLLRVLAPGEASCVACAKARGGVVVTDDRAARSCCHAHGVPCTGTIGILKACCADGSLAREEADSILQAMVQAGYYSPVARISDLL